MRAGLMRLTLRDLLTDDILPSRRHLRPALGELFIDLLVAMGQGLVGMGRAVLERTRGWASAKLATAVTDGTIPAWIGFRFHAGQTLGRSRRGPVVQAFAGRLEVPARDSAAYHDFVHLSGAEDDVQKVEKRVAGIDEKNSATF
jgi:hypothetical protein